MSRNELRVIARIVLIGTGLYILLQLFLNTIGTIAMMPFISTPNTKLAPMLFIALGIYTLVIFGTLYFLGRFANRFSDKIVGQEQVDETQISGIAVAFRLVCVIAGILFLYWTTPNLIVTVNTYISNISNLNNEPGMKQIYTGMSSKTDIAKYVFLLGFGVYLAYGAPGFVRWQVRKTLKQCSKLVEQQPKWD